MVNRGEQTGQCQTYEQFLRALGHADDDRADANAQKVDDHHADLAPAIPEPAGGQSGDTEQHQPQTRKTEQLAIWQTEDLW